MLQLICIAAVLLIIIILLELLSENISSNNLFTLSIRILGILEVSAFVPIYLIDCWNIGIIIIAAGISLNVLVTLLNGGLMPVSLEAFRKSLGVSEDQALSELLILCQTRRRHTLMSDATRLNFLGDKYMSNVMSIGDILIFTGIFVTFWYFIGLGLYNVSVFLSTKLL